MTWWGYAIASVISVAGVLASQWLTGRRESRQSEISREGQRLDRLHEQRVATYSESLRLVDTIVSHGRWAINQRQADDPILDPAAMLSDLRELQDAIAPIAFLADERDTELIAYDCFALAGMLNHALSFWAKEDRIRGTLQSSAGRAATAQRLELLEVRRAELVAAIRSELGVDKR